MCALPLCGCVHVAPESIVLLTPDGGFNCGSVVGKRVPGTWSRVLDVLVLWTVLVLCRDVRLRTHGSSRVGPWRGHHLSPHRGPTTALDVLRARTVVPLTRIQQSGSQYVHRFCEKR